MLFKILVVSAIVIIIIFVIAITIYYNYNKNSNLSGNNDEFIIQLDGGSSRIESITEYCLLKYPKVAIIVIHKPSHNYIKIKNNKYHLTLYNGSRKFMSGFHCVTQESHYVFINKMNYIVTDQQTLGCDGLTISQLHCVDVNFQQRQLTIFVVTIDFYETYFNNVTYSLVLNCFRYILSQLTQPFIIIGNFGCQNWDDIRKFVVSNTQCVSSGKFNLCTYKTSTDIAAPHGVIVSKSVKCNIKVLVEYVQPSIISNELIFLAKLTPSDNVSELSLTDCTVKLTNALTSIDIRHNVMLNGIQPIIEDLQDTFLIKPLPKWDTVQLITLEKLFNILFR
jgi:hypothetical protein